MEQFLSKIVGKFRIIRRIEEANIRQVTFRGIFATDCVVNR